MNRKDNSRARDTRERLKSALLDLLEREDILDVTVSSLCAEAGVNRSTFYAHYDGVGDLMEEMEQEIGKDLLERFGGGNYDEKHMYSVKHLIIVLKYIRANAAFHRAYLRQSTGKRQTEWAFSKLLEMYVLPLMHSLGVKDDAAEYYFTYFKAGFVAVIEMWLQNDCREEPEVIAEYLRNMLMHPAFELEA